MISDIRGFDGERKALVYDNYSKLISATETISRMRTEMDPLAPAVVEKVEPAVERIAVLANEVSRGLVGSGGVDAASKVTDAGVEDTDAQEDRMKKLHTVRWVVDSPRRFRAMIEDGKKEEAEREWEDILRLLEKWKGVKGVEEVKLNVLEVFGGE